MKPFRWDPEKNDQLKQERGVSFEQVAVAVETGNLLQIAPHQNPVKYPRQKIMIVEIDDYAYLVPFVENEDHFFSEDDHSEQEGDARLYCEGELR